MKSISSPTLTILFATSLLAFVQPSLQAQVLTSNLAHGYNVDNTNSGSPAVQTIGGFQGGNVTQASGGRNQLLTFELPDLGGDVFDSAALELFYTSGGTGDRAADLFVYNTLNADGVISSGQASTFSMPWGEDPTPSGWTLIQRSFLDAGSLPSQNSLVSLNATGEANLTSFLNSNYAAGQFLVFGLVMNTTTTSGAFSDGFTFATAGSSPNFVLDTTSELSVAVVPEISTASLLLLGLPLFGLATWRRRRQLS